MSQGGEKSMKETESCTTIRGNRKAGWSRVQLERWKGTNKKQTGEVANTFERQKNNHKNNGGDASDTWDP